MQVCSTRMCFPKEHTHSSSSFLLTAGTGALGTAGTRSSGAHWDGPSAFRDWKPGQAQREPSPGPQLCHGTQPAFPTFPFWEHVSQREQTSSKPLLRLRFPLVIVNSRCSACSEWFLSYINASTRKWTRFKSKYSSYMDLFPGQGNTHWEGNSFLTTGLGDSGCRRLPTTAAHTFPFPLAHGRTRTPIPNSHRLSRIPRTQRSHYSQ